jgi:hypothetical protein
MVDEAPAAAQGREASVMKLPLINPSLEDTTA